MKITELEIGRWYKATTFADYYFKPLEIYQKSILADYYAEGRMMNRHSIGNTNFWECGELVTAPVEGRPLMDKDLTPPEPFLLF